jgi:hypothetical protein
LFINLYRSPYVRSRLLTVVPAVQAAFPSIGAERARAVAIAIITASVQTATTETALIALLTSPNTDIWDLRSRDLQFQDNVQTQPITADGQAVQSIKPMLGGRTMTARSGLTLPTSDQVNGLNFPNSIAVMDFPEKTVRSVVAIFEGRQPNPGLGSPATMILGHTTNYDFVLGGGLLFDRTYASPAVIGGRITVNDFVTEPDVVFPVGVARVSVQVGNQATVLTDSIAPDRSFFDNIFFRTFYGNYRFLLLSETVFADSEIASLNAFAKAYSGL